MASLPHRCPECRASLRGGRCRRDGEKVRCYECGTVIVPGRADNSGGPAMMVLGIGAALALGLLVLGGSAAIWFVASRAPAGPVAAAVPPRPVEARGPAGGARAVPPPVKPQPPPPPAKPDKAVAVPPPPVEAPPATAGSAKVAAPPVKPQPAPPPAEPDKPEAVADPLSLDELKAASVYIEAQMSDREASGSGFVVRGQGDTAYIVTNRHVITTPPEEVGLGPGGRFGMLLPPFVVMRPGQRANTITVVFRGGTPQEQALSAVNVGEDAQDDLAVLKVTGVRDVPRPIDCTHPAKLVVKMPVTILGFPFGRLLKPKLPNPSVTVTQGALSSLRNDLLGRPAYLEIDADINPGNSGGPVVDERGALVGVMSAKWRFTSIGILAPVPALSRLLEGHIDRPNMALTEVVNGRVESRVFAVAADPLGRLRSPTLLYGPAVELKMPARRGEGWDGLTGAKSSALKVGPSRAVAALALDLPPKGDVTFLLQVSFLDGAGRTVYGEPIQINLSDPRGPPGAVSGANLPSGAALTQVLADLKSPDVATRQQAAEALAKAPPLERRKEVVAAVRAVLLSGRAVDEGQPVQQAAVKVLVACDPKEAGPTLVKLLDNEVMRGTALAELKGLKDPRMAEAVAARMPTGDAWAAGEVLKAIGPAAEKAVLPYARPSDNLNRNVVFDVLREIGTEASLPILEKLASGREPDAHCAREALPAVRQRVPLQADDWPQALQDLESANPLVSAAAVRRIAATPPVEARRADVLARLESVAEHHPHVGVSAVAFQGIARWGGEEAVPRLERRLRSESRDFKKVQLLEALAVLKNEAAAAAVANQLRDRECCEAAIKLLKAMGPVAEKPVLPLLGPGEPGFVRMSAAQVLAEVGGRDSLAPLEKASKDKDRYCSLEAELALAAVRGRLEE